MTRRPRAYLRTVRLRLGWSDTALYHAGGPLPYADSELSAELVHDLAHWQDRAWTAVLAVEPMAPATARELRRQVLALGGRVADEIGRDFTVHVLLGSGPRQYRLVRSGRPAANPEAADVLHQRGRQAMTWDRQVRRALRHGTALRWPP